MRDKQTPKDVCGETILTVDSSDLRFLSAYNNGAVVLCWKLSDLA